MTNIEKKLAEKQSKTFKIMNLVSKKIAEYENDMEERRKDHYFADSWEQAAKISRDIEKIENNIIFLYDIKKKLIYGKLTLPECTKMKKLCHIPKCPQFTITIG